jgi:hypothetical protein
MRDEDWAEAMSTYVVSDAVPPSASPDPTTTGTLAPCRCALQAAGEGDNIGFAIGHFGGRALAVRWGRYIFLTEERLDRGESFFNRHGGKIIVAARFIEGLRQANGIIAGISGMRWRRFLVFNALGAALWVGTWVSLGYQGMAAAWAHWAAAVLYNGLARYEQATSAARQATSDSLNPFATM